MTSGGDESKKKTDESGGRGTHQEFSRENRSGESEFYISQLPQCDDENLNADSGRTWAVSPSGSSSQTAAPEPGGIGLFLSMLAMLSVVKLFSVLSGKSKSTSDVVI